MEPTEVTYYRTYGYNEDGVWKIPVRVWVHAKRDSFDPLTLAMRRHNSENFEKRISDFIAHNKTGQAVEFTFDGGSSVRFEGKSTTTNDFGVLEGQIILQAEEAEGLLQSQRSQNGWLSYRAVCGDTSGPGRVQLLGDDPALVSIVSDIDDTIKVTEIPAGNEIVLHNTFFRDFVAVPEIAQKYRDFLPNASFHYVSGGPWPLYRPLADFLIGSQFPEGSFHMQDVNRNLTVDGFLSDLKLLVDDHFNTSAAKKDELRHYKFHRISEIVKSLPHRQFFLMGDSGESDPEAYGDVRTDLPPGRIREIRIRDVVDAEAIKGQPKYRLKDMKVERAPTIVHGISQFDRR